MPERGGSSSLPPWVISLPTITSLAQFNSTTGFLTVAGGGLTAQFDGVPSTATLLMPTPLSISRKFQFGALFEYHTGDARNVLVQLQNPAETSFLGLIVQVGNGGVKASSGISSFYNLLSGLVDGDKFWLGCSWEDSGNCIVWASHDTHSNFASPAVFNGPTHKDYYNAISKTATGGSNGNGPLFTGVDRIVVNTQSVVTKVLAIFARQGDFTSGPSDRFESPCLTNPTIASDVSTLIRRPEYKVAFGAKDLIIIFHGANSSELLGQVDSGGDLGVAVGSLVEAGYATAVMRGTDDFGGTTYSGPKASNWGALPQLNTWWKPLIDQTVSRHGIRNVYFMGLSMGLVNALNMHAAYPGIAKAIVGISGVCNLGYAYASEGFAASINAAYGVGTDAAVVAANDPTARAGLYTNVPIKLWHGTADATLSKANHMDTFAAAVNAITPGSVATVSVVGGDHLTANMFDGAAILAFLQAHV